MPHLPNQMDAPLSSDYDSCPYVSPGMPPLDLSGKTFSFFEFWPSWLIYLPVVIQSLIQAVFYRSLTLPLLANPRLHLGGMVGASKSALLSQADGACRRAILEWFIHCVDEQDIASQVDHVRTLMQERGFEFPVVCKPDIGCRGSGVKLISNEAGLEDYFSDYPRGASIMVQKLASWEPEAGVFYVRDPEEEKGRIISLALKYMPYVVGDGFHTLAQLIDLDPRARHLKHLYADRHADKLNQVIPAGEPYRLIFSASHCKGAVFRDARQHITQALEDGIDALMKELPDFYYGRLDIKFRDLESLEAGRDLEVVEINAASSESLHVWDRNTGFTEATGALLEQYRLLFRIGSKNRKKGEQPPGISALLKGWRLERALTRAYPATD